MILSPTNSEVFFRLWSYIDAYVNIRTNALPGIATPEQMRQAGTQQLFEVRKKLRDEPTLLDDFVRKNPFSLSSSELQEVQQFRRAVCGKFYVERCLKEHAIFISDGQGQPSVYAVRGLSQRIDEVLYRARGLGFAALIESTLLPFRSQIVWDGMVAVHNVSFGPGIRRSFKDAYVRAKERGEIVFSLEPAPPKRKSRPTGRGHRPGVDAIVTAANGLGKTDTSLQGATFRLLKISALMARAALEESVDDLELTDLAKKAARSLKQISEFVERERQEW